MVPEDRIQMWKRKIFRRDFNVNFKIMWNISKFNLGLAQTRKNPLIGILISYRIIKETSLKYQSYFNC